MVFKRQLLFVWLILLVGIPALSFAQGDEANLDAEYHSEDGAVAFRHPSAWTVASDDFGNVYAGNIADPATNFENLAAGEIVLVFYPYVELTSLYDSGSLEEFLGLTGSNLGFTPYVFASSGYIEADTQEYFIMWNSYTIKDKPEQGFHVVNYSTIADASSGDYKFGGFAVYSSPLAFDGLEMLFEAMVKGIQGLNSETADMIASDMLPPAAPDTVHVSPDLEVAFLYPGSWVVSGDGLLTNNPAGLVEFPPLPGQVIIGFDPPTPARRLSVKEQVDNNGSQEIEEFTIDGNLAAASMFIPAGVASVDKLFIRMELGDGMQGGLIATSSAGILEQYQAVILEIAHSMPSQRAAALANPPTVAVSAGTSDIALDTPYSNPGSELVFNYPSGWLVAEDLNDPYRMLLGSSETAMFRLQRGAAPEPGDIFIQLYEPLSREDYTIPLQYLTDRGTLVYDAALFQFTDAPVSVDLDGVPAAIAQGTNADGSQAIVVIAIDIGNNTYGLMSAVYSPGDAEQSTAIIYQIARSMPVADSVPVAVADRSITPASASLVAPATDNRVVSNYEYVFAPDSGVLAYLNVTTLKIIDFSTGRMLFEQDFDFRGNRPLTVRAISLDGNLVAYSIWDVLSLFDVRDGSVREFVLDVSPTGVPGIPDSVAFSLDGTRIAYVSNAQTVRVVDVASAQRVAILPVTEAVNLRWHPDGNTLFGGSSTGIYIWDVAANAESAVIQSNGEGITWDVSPNGRYLGYVTARGNAMLWDTETQEAVQIGSAAFPYRGSVLNRINYDPQEGIVFSPDGRHLAYTGAGNAIHLWDIQMQKDVLTLAAHKTTVAQLAFNTSGNVLASITIAESGIDSELRLWDSSTGELLTTLETGFDKRPEMLDFAASDNYLVAAANERNYEILKWTIPEGVDVPAYEAPVQTGGSTLAYGDTVTGSLDGAAVRWEFAGNAGDIVTITVSSAAFDTLLEVYDASQSLITANDDASLATTDSELVGFQIPSTGTFTIGVTSSAGTGAGEYTLSISLDSGQ